MLREIEASPECAAMVEFSSDACPIRRLYRERHRQWQRKARRAYDQAAPEKYRGMYQLWLGRDQAVAKHDLPPLLNKLEG
jgi:hypothetical protein